MPFCDLGMPIKVFLDTNVFISNGYNFTKGSLLYISNYIEQDLLELYIDSVVKNEVLNNIKKDSDEVYSEYKGAKKRSRRQISSLSDNDEFSGLFNFPTNEIISQCITKNFLDYIEQYNFTEIEPQINIVELLQDYFNQNAPFNGAGKKEEFPDAIIIQTILQYCRDNDCQMIVISNDNHFTVALGENDSVILYEDVRAFLTELNTYIHKTITDLLNDWNLDKSEEKRIKDYICDLLYDSSNIVVEGAEGEDVEVEYINSLLLKLESIDYIEQTEARISISVEADFDIMYSLFNADESVYDPEDKVYIFEQFDVFYEQHKTTFTISADVTVYIDNDSFEINEFDQDFTEIELDDSTLLSRKTDKSEEGDSDYAEITTCPDCGGKISRMNDGGNGFCIKCAHKH